MERLTNKELIKCQGCIEKSNCYNHSCSHINEAIQKLKYYEDLVESGLLIKLPCDYNDTLYWIANGYIKEVWFKGIRCDKGYKPQIICRYLHNLNTKEEPICAFENIGKTVFLTRDEAELKLKEMQNE